MEQWTNQDFSRPKRATILTIITGLSTELLKRKLAILTVSHTE